MHDWLFTFGVVMSAGLCGAGFLGPFVARKKLMLLSAPLVGILLVVLGANAAYAVLGVPYKTATTLSVVACLGVSGIAWRVLVDWRRLVLLVILAAAMSALAVWTVDRATLRCGSPAIFYMDGTDQGGYAQMADWLNDHPVEQYPVADPSVPYQSWPEILFQYDPRFGSFGLLAIVARLYGSSGLFSYNIACAVFLSAACVSVAAVYAPSVIWLAALSFGLFISNLFDYAHCGFFGKLVAYPSALLLAGFVLNSLQCPTIDRIFVLAMLACAIGLMHSGTASVVLIAPILATALIVLGLGRCDSPMLVRAALMCGLALVLPIMASGILARPVAITYPDWNTPWSYMLPRVLDLENQNALVSRAGPRTLLWMMWAAAATWAAALAIAVRRRSPPAIGLLAGPAILLAAMALFHNRAAAFQMLGFIYPATLCGTVVLFEQMPVASGRIAVVALAALAIGLRFSRFLGSVSRYETHPVARYVFTETEIKQLAARIGPQSVQVDVSEPHEGILLLVELGRRQLNVDWSRDAWQIVVGYRRWPWTPPATPPNLLLKRSADPHPGRQFELIKLSVDGPRD